MAKGEFKEILRNSRKVVHFKTQGLLPGFFVFIDFLLIICHINNDTCLGVAEY